MCYGQETLSENHRSNGDPQRRSGQQGATGRNPHPQLAGDGGQQAAFVYAFIIMLI